MFKKDRQKFMVLTYGCQMNKHDAEKAVYLLEETGLEKTEDQEEADMILLLTCSVREKAESKVFGKLGELQLLKRKKPHLFIGIGGCMTQQQEMAQKIKTTYPHVDLVLGTHNLHRLQKLVAEAQKRQAPLIEITEQDKGLPAVPFTREKKYFAWVSIIAGCSNFCSYCIVPYVRGQERSRPYPEIITEVEGLASDGVVEVTLLGQNVNAYGRDQRGGKDFAALLEAINSIPQLARIRFTTSHPRDFHSPIIQATASLEKVCEHIHLPLQSGSSKILKKMNRGYTREEYLDLVAEMKETIDGVSLTTDIMVGFPGETEEDFSATLEVLREVRFSSIFTFLYSPRRNTLAARMEDPVPKEEKKERFKRLLQVQNQINWEENQKYVQQVVEVLGEGKSKKDATMQMGRTRTNQVVIFPANGDWEGKLVPVEILEAKSWNLMGTLISL